MMLDSNVPKMMRSVDIYVPNESHVNMRIYEALFFVCMGVIVTQTL